METTLVLGASTKEERYSNMAIHLLQEKNHSVIAFGVKSGIVNGVEIQTAWNESWKVATVTLYINPELQKQYYNKIIALKPKRVIFNPGTENKEFEYLLLENNITFENACTLVLLRIGHY